MTNPHWAGIASRSGRDVLSEVWTERLRYRCSAFPRWGSVRPSRRPCRRRRWRLRFCPYRLPERQRSMCSRYASWRYQFFVTLFDSLRRRRCVSSRPSRNASFPNPSTKSMGRSVVPAGFARCHPSCIEAIHERPFSPRAIHPSQVRRRIPLCALARSGAEDFLVRCLRTRGASHSRIVFAGSRPEAALTPKLPCQPLLAARSRRPRGSRRSKRSR